MTILNSGKVVRVVVDPKNLAASVVVYRLGTGNRIGEKRKSLHRREDSVSLGEIVDGDSTTKIITRMYAGMQSSQIESLLIGHYICATLPNDHKAILTFTGRAPTPVHRIPNFLQGQSQSLLSPAQKQRASDKSSASSSGTSTPVNNTYGGPSAPQILQIQKRLMAHGQYWS